MAKFSRFVVAFDDGTKVEAQSSSRDLLRLEKDGIKLDELGAIEGSYLLAWVTLQRLARTGVIDVDVPATADALADVADLEPYDDEDPEGNGSGQEAPTGS